MTVRCSIGFLQFVNVADMSKVTLYTVGHSNYSRLEFISLLRSWRIEELIDIRAYPRSRRLPHFASEQLRGDLGRAGIFYRWAGRELGGMRRTDPASPHLALSEGLRGYADHSGSAGFVNGVMQLLDVAQVKTVTVMCAEKYPLHCHRSLLSDHLIVQHGVEVRHILGMNEDRPHDLRPEARLVDKSIVYDRHVQSELNFS